MARYGQLLLRRLTFQYCDLMGSSRGVREYIQESLPAFAERNPHLQISTVRKRNKFPLVRAEYALLPNSAAHLQRQLDQQQQQEQALQQLPRKERRQLLLKQAAEQRFNSNVIGLKHSSPSDIREVVWWLSQSQCRPKTRRIPSKHVMSKQTSIQGEWTPSTFGTAASQP